MFIDFKGLLRSAKFFLFHPKRHYDVVFYYPAHFNRGENNSNVFFKPLYEICSTHNIKYIVLEEPDLHTKYPRNNTAIPFDLPFLIILVLRKFIKLDKFKSFQHRDWYIAEKLRPIFFKNFHFHNYIVLSNSMLAFFRGLEKNANLYDYQHGVIFSGHPGYLTDHGEAAAHIKLNEANVLLYGKGFQEVLLKNDRTDYYKNHSFPLGIDKKIPKIKKTTIQNEWNILFSLQFTGTGEFAEKQYHWVETIHNFLESNRQFFEENNVQLLLKHHPRYNGSIDITPILQLDFVKTFKGDMWEGLRQSFLHLTFYSTSIFDASYYGIPTLLWQHEFSLANVFVDDFGYPLGVDDDTSLISKIKRFMNNKKDYINASQDVQKWYKNIYSPLNERVFVELTKPILVKESLNEKN